MSVRPSLGARLGFVWAAVWVSVWTIVFSPCVVVHSALRPGARTFMFWARLWARVVLFGVGVRVRAEDRAKLPPGQPVVFAANHQNSMDILVAAAGVPYDFGFAAKAGLRKPDPRIYQMMCELLAVAPGACVYLDDLGVNCKPAAQLGMTAIKVTGEAQALAELSKVTGLEF